MRIPFTYRRTSPRIISIEAGFPPVSPIEPISIDSLIIRFGARLQARLIPRRGDAFPRLWILTEDWDSTVETDEGVIRRHAKAGWVTDFGSIPAVLESIQKRDDRSALVGFLNHDIDFAIQGMSFDSSNCQLHQTITYADRLQGLDSPFKAWRIWRAVQSDIAFKAYEKDPAMMEYEKRWASVKWDAK